MSDRISLPAEEKLVDALVADGCLRREDAQAVLARVVETERSAVDVLVSEGLVREDSIARALAESLGISILDPSVVDFDEFVVRIVDQATAQFFRVVPVRLEGQELLLGMENPLDDEAIHDLEFQTGRLIRPAVMTASGIRESLSTVYGAEGALRTLVEGLPLASGFSVEPSLSPSGRGIAEDMDLDGAPVVKLVNRLLVDAVSKGASDVHIEPGENVVTVRIRVNGMLEDALELPSWIQSAIVARIKVMAGLDITERRLPQDGRIRARHGPRSFDIRVSSLPIRHGEKIVLRLLDPAQGIRSLDALGLTAEGRAILERAIHRPEGLILVTGPTGSGKTTTLYAVLKEISTRERNITTIENPVEYQIAGINQVEIDPRQGRTFATTLRSILRQDPDVILVGEIRDEETAKIAIQAAQTGHLVFSTVHTNDSLATIPRFIGLGVPPADLASALLLVVSQRLMRTVCPENHPTPGAAAGCPRCRGTGYAGRTGVYELLPVTAGLRDRIASGDASAASLREQAKQEGFRPLREAALEKVRSGITTEEEMRRTIQVEDIEPDCPVCDDTRVVDGERCPGCAPAAELSCASCGRSLDLGWTVCPWCGTSRLAPDGEPAHAPEGPVIGKLDRIRVLIADDHADLRHIVRRTLERSELPIDVLEAADGKEALEVVRRDEPHALILDIMMPELDGFEVCRELRADLRTAMIPVLMLTAREDRESRLEGFLSGTDDYIVKPFDRRELLVRLHRLLERTYGIRAPESGTDADGEAATA